MTRQRDRERVQAHGRVAGSALRVHEVLTRKPITSLSEVQELTGLSFPTAGKAMRVLADEGIVSELTGRKRNRVFGYGEYVAVLMEGTEP